MICFALAAFWVFQISSGSPPNTDANKCPPGKYTKVSGSDTTKPQCAPCATGFYKAETSPSSTCIGSAGRCVPWPSSDINYRTFAWTLDLWSDDAVLAADS